MAGKKIIAVAALSLLGLSTGCCSWAQRWCPPPVGQNVSCAPPAAVSCGCPPQQGVYYPPAVAAPAPTTWSQPRTLNGCTCSCP